MASSAQSYYLQSALELVLFPILQRSQLYAALPRLSGDRHQDSLMGIALNSYNETRLIVGGAHTGTLPSLWEAVQAGR